MSYMMMMSATMRHQKDNDSSKDRLEKAKRSSGMTILLYNQNTRKDEIQVIYKAEIGKDNIMLSLCDDGWVGLKFEDEFLKNQCMLELFSKQRLDWRFEPVESFAGVYAKKC